MNRSLYIGIALLFISPLSNLFGQEMEVKRLKLNSRESEYCPTIYKDGIVFISHRKTDAIYSYYDSQGNFTSDFYFAANKDGKYRDVELFASEISSNLNEGPSCFSSDQTEIYFTKSIVSKDKIESIGIFRSERNIDGTWREPTAFKFNSDGGEYDVAHPSISEDNQTLYFTSNREDSYGGFDLYFCTRSSDGEWNEPIHLGKNINTEKNEGYPLISRSGRLYFSSSGHSENMGMDILYTISTGENKWSTPQLMEAPINSKHNDFGIAIDESNEQGFFSSDRDKKFKEEIYSFKFKYPTFENCLDNYEPYLCYLIKDENVVQSDSLPFKYIWDMGHGVQKEGFSVEHCFPGYGSYDISLQIFDTITNQIFAQVSEVQIVIDKMPQAHISSPDTIYQGETINFVADELDHLPFQSDGYYWNIDQVYDARGKELDYVFNETGTHQVIFGSIDVNDKKNKQCVTKDIVVVNDEILARIKNDEKYKRQDALNLLALNKIEIQDLKKADYSSDKSLQVDTSYYFVQLTESQNQLSLQDDFFSKTDREITERHSVKDKKYIYSVGEEFELTSLYGIYKELVDSGYTQALVQEDMKGDFMEETTKKGYFMPDSVRLALNKEINEFANILFEYNSFDIKTDSYDNLNSIAEFMFKEPGMRLNIMAHTDNHGKPKYNQILSEKRAQSVVNYFTNLGIPSFRFIPIGYGSSTPIAPNNSEENRALNRRVEFEIIVEEIFD